MRKFFAFSAGYLSFLAGVVWGQEPMPVGKEFQVNTYTTDAQARPTVASHPGGDFVVVWQSDGQDGSGYGVFGQRYDSSGTPLDSEFQVNTYTTGREHSPDVASDGVGNFVIVWNSISPFASGPDTVFGQRYSNMGEPLGAEFLVTTYNSGGLAPPFLQPRVASDDAGNFVVVWQVPDRDGDGYGIFAQRYDSSGVTTGSDFQVNSYTTYSQIFPVVAFDRFGNSLFVWLDDNTLDTFGQRYNSLGSPLGDEFQVNMTSPGAFHSVTSDDGGNFIIVWNGSTGIVGQKFDSMGLPLGEFQVNDTTPAAVETRAITADGAGNFVVAWRIVDQDGYGIAGRSFDSLGTPLSPEFQINNYTVDDQISPAVSSDDGGNFVVFWQGRDGDASGIVGQRYGAINPPLFSDGFESGDTTTWSSVVGL